jgi:hypothetical protein
MHEDHAADGLARPGIANEPDTTLPHRRHLRFDILNGQCHQVYPLPTCCQTFGYWTGGVGGLNELQESPPGQVVEGVLEAVVGALARP